MTNSLIRQAKKTLGPKVIAWVKKNAPGYIKKFKAKRAAKKGKVATKAPVAQEGVQEAEAAPVAPVATVVREEGLNEDATPAPVAQEAGLNANSPAVTSVAV
ncbi:hypothetical protein GLAREA_06175 [Glarea lozoyensis ATCC 20868]|uniref:Uncharacterized protein n=1 Tax=Glarea lozoyensis (strain ATCC 20868 / MF5171) TaxID=1116229 RepID=S3E3Y5_GLAL2|nr:uncharacterized protein GLAREA_06175 [Glarea lozoyensis ATCC 20868]EPE33163.1 hypothetical protein GLAREA_06175 [Glarea lozoyensis ATCC 20868]